MMTTYAEQVPPEISRSETESARHALNSSVQTDESSLSFLTWRIGRRIGHFWKRMGKDYEEK